MMQSGVERQNAPTGLSGMQRAASQSELTVQFKSAGGVQSGRAVYRQARSSGSSGMTPVAVGRIERQWSTVHGLLSSQSEFSRQGIGEQKG